MGEDQDIFEINFSKGRNLHGGKHHKKNHHRPAMDEEETRMSEEGNSHHRGRHHKGHKFRKDRKHECHFLNALTKINFFEQTPDEAKDHMLRKINKILMIVMLAASLLILFIYCSY